MNIQEHKSPLLNTRFTTICDPFEFIFGGNKYTVYLKKGKNAKNQIYAKISDGIVILGQYKVYGLQNIPTDRNKLEVLAHSAFSHYLSCEVYNA